MGKRKHSGNSNTSAKRQYSNLIISFWETHYSHTNSNNIIQSFEMPNILAFFMKLHPDFPQHLHVSNMFFQVSTNSLNIPFHRENKVPIFHVFPVSDEALLFHNFLECHSVYFLCQNGYHLI